MPEQDFPSERQQPSSELEGILVQIGQPWWGFVVGLIVGLIVLVGALTFFWLSWFAVDVLPALKDGASTAVFPSPVEGSGITRV